MREDVMHDRIKSTLRIEENHRKYYGTYSCTVINKYGSDTLNIVFSERRKLKIYRLFEPREKNNKIIEQFVHFDVRLIDRNENHAT